MDDGDWLRLRALLALPVMKYEYAGREGAESARGFPPMEKPVSFSTGGAFDVLQRGMSN